MEVHMDRQQVNRFSSWAMISLSAIALAMVLLGCLTWTGPSKDEGALAHIFQIAIVLLLPAGLTFLATIDWRVPRRSTRPLTITVLTVAVAFGALYILEHYR